MKNKKISIVVGLTDTYLEKSLPLFLSLSTHADGCRICILIIKTMTQQPERKVLMRNWDVQVMEISDLPTYRKDWPRNKGREFYACIEGGEFLKYFKFDDDEVIIKLDADFIMQREMSDLEWSNFQLLQHGQVMGNYTSYPPTTLREEYWKLMPAFGYVNAKAKFPGEWTNMPMFCAGFMACTAATYKRISKAYLHRHYEITTVFHHHAAGQWLMNWIVGTAFTFRPQPPSLHNALWYIDTPCYVRDEQLYYQDIPVLFNHTKFEKFKF